MAKCSGGGDADGDEIALVSDLDGFGYGREEGSSPEVMRSAKEPMTALGPRRTRTAARRKAPMDFLGLFAGGRWCRQERREVGGGPRWIG